MINSLRLQPLRTDPWSQGTPGEATQNIVICQCLADQLFALKSKAGANIWYTRHWQITIFCSTSSNHQEPRRHLKWRACSKASVAWKFCIGRDEKSRRQGSHRVLNLEKVSAICQTWKKSGKMVKSRGFFQSYNNCFIGVFLRFGQISFNLARAFAMHRKESFVPALLKVYIDNLFVNLESGKRNYCFGKKV